MGFIGYVTSTKWFSQALSVLDCLCGLKAAGTWTSGWSRPDKPQINLLTSSCLGSILFPLLLCSGIFITTPRAKADSVIISFPAANSSSTGFETSARGSLLGNIVRIGAFNTDPTSLMAGVSSLTSSSAVLSNLHSRFTQYTSFNFSSDYLSSEPGFGTFPIEDPVTGRIPPQPDITATFRGKDIYVLFYNAADENIATEVAIFRMKQDLLDDDPDFSFGKFNTDASPSDGKRNAQFNLTPGETDLLLGFYDSSLDIFQTADLNAGANQITSPLTQTNASGAVSTYQIVANNGADRFFATTNTGSTDLTLTTLPTGFSIATNTGVITAATNAAGTNTIRLIASNSLTASVATNILTWTLQASSLSFTTTTNLISAVAGVEISPFTFVSTGTSPTYTADGNLLGLTLSTNGILSGIPNSVGTNDVSITSSAGGQNGNTTFSLAVAAPTISVPAGELPGGQIVHIAGTARTVTLSKTDGFTDLTGEVSPTTSGVSFNGTDLVIAADAVPLVRGLNNITLTLTASKVGVSGASASTTVPLRIVAPTPTRLVGPTEFEVDVGQAFSSTILSDAGTYGRMSFSNLPSELASFANGQVLGTQTNIALGYQFAVRVVADSTQIYEGGGSYTNTNVIFRLRNTNAPYFASTTNRHIVGAGRPINPINLIASNFPFQYTASNLPSGLRLSGNQISGTPTVAGIFTVPITASNSFRPGSTNPADWQGGSATLIFHIAGTKPTASALPSSPGAIPRNSTISLNDNVYLIPGGAENQGVRLAAYGLPPGVSLEPTTGKLYGTTGGAGSYNATVFVQNGKGWIKKIVTLTVQ